MMPRETKALSVVGAVFATLICATSYANNVGPGIDNTEAMILSDYCAEPTASQLGPAEECSLSEIKPTRKISELSQALSNSSEQLHKSDSAFLLFYHGLYEPLDDESISDSVQEAEASLRLSKHIASSRSAIARFIETKDLKSYKDPDFQKFLSLITDRTQPKSINSKLALILRPLMDPKRDRPASDSDLHQLADILSASMRSRLDENETNTRLEKIKTGRSSIDKVQRLREAGSRIQDYIDLAAETATLPIRTSDQYVDCRHSVAEVLSLYFYTGDGFTNLNKALRTHPTVQTPSARRYINTVVPVLNRALDRVKPYRGIVNRGAFDLPPEVLAQHQVGEVVEYKAYTSAAIDSGFDARYRFVIHSKTGRYIAPYSKHNNEKEVLFKPGARFKVISIEKNPDHTVFTMEEVE
ncbi:MAG: hypothetical protein IPJ84_09610 [Bdellovibrionales bacterium]|nr:hypothetical protein [Bdellovibrionales bacterium]